MHYTTPTLICFLFNHFVYNIKTTYATHYTEREIY
jgi:hypothetical protein